MKKVLKLVFWIFALIVWGPKASGCPQTRARDQDDRREARLVSVRMLRPERGSGGTNEQVTFEWRFATVCAGLQIGQRMDRRNPGPRL
jgi:hypothetical protein